MCMCELIYLDMSNRRPFTCYFCNELIENETEIGHTTLCSKVLISCPYKCGAYVQRAHMTKHKGECVNNVRKSTSLELSNAPKQGQVPNTNSLDRNRIASINKNRVQDDIGNLYRRFSELEARLRTLPNLSNGNSATFGNNEVKESLEEIKSTLKKQSQVIQKTNYFIGFMSEWKKNIESQVSSLKTFCTSIESFNKEKSKQWNYIQEKLLYLQHLQMDLNLLKETVYNDNANSKKNEMNFSRNMEELKSVLNEQNETYHNMWSEQNQTLENIIRDIQSTKQLIDEQKAKYAGLVFDLRAVSQISSEAAERIEIQEREFKQMYQEFNQMKVDMEILEGLATSGDSESGCYERLLWRIDNVESKMNRAKENGIVLKSPIFYTYRYGYKIRVLLYLNGLKKWRDRYALACVHVLKGEYDPLLTWPCTIEGNITLRDLGDTVQPKNFSKFTKIKRTNGDEEEDEPQESSLTYIFIPHTILLKDNYLKDDTIFLDVTINRIPKNETSL